MNVEKNAEDICEQRRWMICIQNIQTQKNTCRYFFEQDTCMFFLQGVFAYDDKLLGFFLSSTYSTIGRNSFSNRNF